MEQENDNAITHQAELAAEDRQHMGSSQPSRAPGQYIGIVNWFNSEKGFGVIVTNGKSFEGVAPDKTNNPLEEVFVHANDCGNVAFKRGDWVEFNSVRFRKKKFCANGTRPITYDIGTIRSALKYRGTNGLIKGIASVSKREIAKYNESILGRVLTRAIVAGIVASDIRKAITEFFQKFPQEQWKVMANEYLNDAKVEFCLRGIYLCEDNYGIAEDDRVTILFQRKIAGNLITQNGIEAFNTLPEWFNLNDVQNEIFGTLNQESDENTLLNYFSQPRGDLFLTTLTDGRLKDLSPAARLALAMFLNDESWLKAFEPTDWQVFAEWIQTKSKEIQVRFLWAFYEDRSKAFCAMHPFASCGDEVRKTFVARYGTQSYDWQRRVGLFDDLAEFCATNDTSMFRRLLASGYDFERIKLQLKEKINTLVNSDIQKAEAVFSELLASPVGSKVFTMDGLGNAALMYAFALRGDINLLNAISDFDAATEWLGKQTDEIVLKFIKRYLESGLVVEDDSNDPFFKDFSREKLAQAIKILPEEEQYLFAAQLPENILIDISWNYMRASSLFKTAMREIWERRKSQIHYCAFDLESDGEKINEFAFISDKGVQSYTGEEQLNSLLRALKRTEIIVGHNIRKWDIGEVLSKKGFESNAFVWDTLEIEILLNPCRYAYSLHTVHRAADDVELTDELFWDQLYRISKDESICRKFQEFFPPSILEILDQLKRPWFVEFFSSVSQDPSHFFQAPSELNQNLLEKLRRIGVNAEARKSLLVAPRELWGHIAHHIEVSFPTADSLDYFPLSLEKIANQVGFNAYLKSVLLRFADLSKTPIPANLAQYIRLEYFSDDVLKDCVSVKEANVQCVDVESVDENLMRRFAPEDVYFIGFELVNRLHQYRVPGEWDASAFIEQKCWIPMKLAAASYAYVGDNPLDTQSDAESDTDKIRRIVDGNLLDEAQSIWVEKLPNGKFSICYSINIAERIKKAASGCSKDHIHLISWCDNGDARNCPSLKVVTSAREMGAFDPRDVRVLPGTSQRAAYWAYQFKLLQAIREDASNRPIVYIVEEDEDVDAAAATARDMGYVLPGIDGMAKKVAFLVRHRNSLLVLTKRDLDQFLALKSDVPFCFAWDNMAVEKCMMMWRGKLFGDEAKLDNYHDSNGMKASGLSPRDAMLSAWPIYRHYYDLMIANNSGSTVYLLEPYLDDYPELAEAWHTGAFAARLWQRDTEYKADLKRLSKVLPKKNIELDAVTEEMKIAKAKQVIGEMLLPKNASWHNYQDSVLENILSKKNDYIISIPTGGGKSILFQGPALYNSMYSNRLSIVITPLKALMEDQINGLVDKGFALNVDFLNGDRTFFETKQIYRRVASGEISLLYVTPERFRSRAFINALSRRIASDEGLEYFIFDEAHCISQWGQEFRPDYLHVIAWCRELKRLHPRTCVTLYSATVTGQIESEARQYLPGVKRIGQAIEDYNPIRSHISMRFEKVGASDKERRNAITTYVQDNNVDIGRSRMLVFCLLRDQCEDSANSLDEKLRNITGINNHGYPCVDYFHAGLSGEEREDAIERFRKGDTPFLCATKAFGMGMDIPNVHYIVHYSPPRVLEDYLQEVGRAGRNTELCHKAGFNDEHPIPAVCLVAEDDFRRHVDLLLTGQLVWSDLSDVLERLKSYILSIQPLEKSQIEPVAIPVSLWSKERFNGDTTMFRLSLYWLEQLGRIKLGFSQPANIMIELLQEKADSASPLFAGNDGAKVWALYERIRQISKARGNNRIQVTQSELRIKHKINARMVMNVLVKCAKYKLVSIEQTIQCATSNIRYSEVGYVVNGVNGVGTDEAKRNLLALHWLFEYARKIADRACNHTGFELIVTPPLEEDVYNELREDTMSLLDEYLKDDVDGEGQPRKVMPWHNPEARSETRGFFIAENYRKDFRKRRVRFAYDLLAKVRGVAVRNVFLPQYPARAIKVVRGDFSDARSFLDAFEADSWNVLANIHKWPEQSLRWTDLMMKCDLADKGFQYFADIIFFLSAMAYIQTESLLPSGIEVYSTARTGDPILPEPDEETEDHPVKRKFDEVATMRKVRLAAMNAFSKIPVTEHGHFIQRYFQCASLDEYRAFIGDYASADNEIASMLTDEALSAKVGELDNEQRLVYEAPLHTNVNVLAGPGSGKTHLLTLRCARLIYKDGVEPRNILVLAYNRAVVVELKNRLGRLFRNLGMSRRAAQLHVHTFHALAKKICGTSIDSIPLDQWERKLVERLKGNPNDIRQILGDDIQYVLIDEFQDITQIRLNAMGELRRIYPAVSFFTIGDKNQSIYGFERRSVGEPVSPDYYYEKLEQDFHPITYNMMTNYRSYQGILDAAAAFIPQNERAHLPHSAHSIMKNVPQGRCVRTLDCQPADSERWYEEFDSIVEEAGRNRFQDIAVFFRTKAEVYYGYSLLKEKQYPNVRLRVQGASTCELWRTREMYSIIRYLEMHGGESIVFKDETTKRQILSYVQNVMRVRPSFDMFYLDLAYALALDFIDSVENEERVYTFADMAAEMKEASNNDDGQLYKIYDKYRAERILSDSNINVVLTTMHKVKGLEFDSVVITPSHVALPLDFKGLPLSSANCEDMEEERRLMFVAYTRARKSLRVYRSCRERTLGFAGEELVGWAGDEAVLGYHDEPGLEKLYLSYLALSNKFACNKFVKSSVVKNAPVSIHSSFWDGRFKGCRVLYDGHPVGFLSTRSRIRERMRIENATMISGLFVNEVLVWTYRDTEEYDRKNGTTFAQQWCDEAKKQGFIYLVDYAGYGR